MKPLLKAAAILVCLVVIAGIAVVGYILSAGLSARNQPRAVDEFVARNIRRVVVARQARGLRNPVATSQNVLVEARAHYADHCAVCHANDGSGNTEMGRGLFPKAPDMRLASTQNLSDGELFWIIENGIRFTGMPAWSTGTNHGVEDSWKLVHFIRHLPALSAEDISEMEAMNPRSPDEIRQELEEKRFLEGGDVPPVVPEHTHGGQHD
jgi:mono/diheme cytochrome c family protein